MYFGETSVGQKKTHIIAKSYQKTLRKWMKAKHDLHFLHECKSHIVHPKFAHWKNIKNKTPKKRNNSYNKKLNSAINKKRQELKTLTKKHSSILKNEKDSTTWMKATLVIYSIKQQQNKLCKKTHHKKLDNLVIYKRINDGTRKNPNETITHLSDIELNDD